MDKKTERITFWTTESDALKLMRLAAAQNRSLSEYMFCLTHIHINGHIALLDDACEGADRAGLHE